MDCLVIGLGVFGKSVAKSLSNNGASVLGVDMNEKTLQEVQSFLNETVILDVAVEANIRSLGVEHFDYCFVCIGANMEANLMATLHLSNLGAAKIIGRSNSKTHESLLRKIGVYRIVSPEVGMGEQIVEEVISGLDSFTRIKGDIVMVTIDIPTKMVGKTLAELSLRAKYRINLLWIDKRIPYIDQEGENFIYQRDEEIVATDYVFNNYDHITILGKFQNINKFIKTFSDNSEVLERISSEKVKP